MATLITGGSGFIGAEVVRTLLNMGKKNVVIFDVDPSTKRLDDVANQVELIRGDVGNFSHVLSIVKSLRPTAIYHLGGMLSLASDLDPPGAIHSNVLGTSHILEAARLFDVSQVLYSSTIGTYGLDIRERIISDYTLQRPEFFYGATKVFCEHMGLFYRRKYGLDFRGVRYPSVVGPGVKTPGVVQFTSWVIEESAYGKTYTVYVKPETRCPIIYFKDAARAIIELGEAPIEDIRMVNYLVAGVTPVASAEELVEMVKEKISTAQIDFKPDLEIQKILDKLSYPIDDRVAKEEWNWKPKYNQEKLIDDFLEEIKTHPTRYL